MPSSVVLITGTSSGIGLATAVAAGAAGHRVIATMRNLQNDEHKADALRTAASAAGVSIDIRSLDVTDAAAIQGCVDGIIADYGRLDAVINNAGAGHVGTIELESVDAVRAVMETNFFSVVTLTKAAFTHLRASRGCLITVSSVGGAVGQPFNEAYCSSKFAVEGFMESLTPVAATVGVRVNVVEPGPVSTEFVANVGADAPAMIAAAGDYAPAMLGYLQRTQQQFSSARAQSASDVAAVIVDLLTADAPPARVQTSPAASAFVGVKLADLNGSAVQTMTSGWVHQSTPQVMTPTEPAAG
ncbi:SDR family NAD(P)-dependent oxidoreductase [Rathayibacter soli]|uniref:SDR family NAD(P)-dependent oxidoreductase n=1 Tax=Rathayibacter soli TaxID=3144168 RepID=UPI0027E529ED|nr:SDR family NAD(P)-dependent oxidoreductase [Glaciibacter superstes]